MKKIFFIYYYSQELNRPLYEQGHSAQIEAEGPVQALKKWYNHINQLAGDFKNFSYHSEEIPNI